MMVFDVLTSLLINFQLYSYSMTFYIMEFFMNFLLLLDNLLSLVLDFMEFTTYFNLSSSSFSLMLMALKFLFCISLLMFASGGMPSFSFDYLTKLGWIRFLSLVLLFFLTEMFLLSLI